MNLIEIATRRRVTVGMATVAVLLFGLIALADLKINLLPELSYPTLTVRTEYAGAAPVEIENLISEPVEEALGVVKNVRRVRSVSRAGQSDVILEFAWGTDMDLAALEVREKLELLVLPLEAKRPQLLRFDPSTEPILRYALIGASTQDSFDEAELKRLRRFADEQLKKRLEPVAGVAAVKVGGGLEDEVQVEIDQQKLKQLNLSVGQIIERLRAENVNVSGGRLDEGSQRYLVRTINQFATVEEIGAMLLRPNGQVGLRLRDVATVKQGYRERESVVRVDGREAVEIAIYKEGDANTVAVADAVKRTVERLQKDRQLPPSTDLQVIDDQSRFIRSALDEVKSAAILGGLLAILVIFLFLRDAWSTFVIGISLPVSVLATFFFMGQLGISLNVMSLGGLALATGMVVDASIVVLENISRLRERGLGAFEAAVEGTQEVAAAITASVLTSVAVFFPLVFVEGVAGQLFRDQALTVTVALLVSLAVSLTLIPMLSSLRAELASSKPGEAPPTRSAPMPSNPLLRSIAVGFRAIGIGIRFTSFWLVRSLGRGFALTARILSRVMMPLALVTERGFGSFAAYYARILPVALNHPGRVLGIAAAALVAALVVLPSLGLDLVPQLAQGRYVATLKLPPGTPLAQTDAVVRAIQLRHRDDPEIATIHGVSGAGTRLDANPVESGENIGRLVVVLTDGASAADEARSMVKLRKTAQALGVRDANFERPALLNYSTPLEIEIAAYDLDRLRAAGRTVVEALSGLDRFTDVKSSVEQGQPEIQIRFDQERAAALGLSTRQIADQVVRKVRGEVATRYSFRERKIDVLVRAQESDRASVEDLRNLIVNPESEKPVTLAAVADIVVTEGPGEIHRSEQQRVAIVSANLAHGDLGSAVIEAQRAISNADLPAGVQVRISGQSEELDASLDSMLFALGLAVFLVYLVMASQFESLLHPFVILLSIPLAIVGAVFGLKAFAMPLSVIAGIGIILLAGIVVNNAIVLIDRVNQLRGEGVPKFDALLEAGRSRLRAITMTTLTTLVGFLPMALGFGDGAEIRRPLAITVIAGLTISTVLTLVVIPVVYRLLDRRPDSAFVEDARRARRLLAME